MNYFNVFFDVDYEYEVGYSLSIIVLLRRGDNHYSWEALFLLKIASGFNPSTLIYNTRLNAVFKCFFINLKKRKWIHLMKNMKS
jgi:hypothetical protein